MSGLEPTSHERSGWNVFNPRSEEFQEAERIFHEDFSQSKWHWKQAVVVIASMIGALFLIVGAFPLFCWTVKALQPGENSETDKTANAAQNHFQHSPTNEKTTADIPSSEVNQAQKVKPEQPLNTKAAEATFTRAGFQNPGACCYAIAALQCLSSIKDFLPSVEQLVQNTTESEPEFQKRKQTARLILSILEKSQQPGTTVGPNDLVDLFNKLGMDIRQVGDSKEFIRELINIFEIKIRLTEFCDNPRSFVSNYPIFLMEENNKIFKKARENNGGILNYQMSFDYRPNTNHIIFNRVEVSLDPSKREEKEIPFTLRYENNPSIFELVAASISEGGHNIAYAKDHLGWQRLDDDTVSREETSVAEKAIRKDSFILVYREK